jgi:hypothetical protein
VGLVVPHPLSPDHLWSAGHNGLGQFVIKTRSGSTVLVPDDWRPPLASHLLAGSGCFSPEVTRMLRKLEQRAKKKQKLTPEDAGGLAALATALENLLNEYLEADPKTSTRYEWRPEYYEDRAKRYGLEKKDRWQPAPKEEVDDEPAPWEKA